jgi:hypothetical protein
MIGGVLTEEQKAAMLAKLNAANKKIQDIKTPTNEELDELLKSVDKEGPQIPSSEYYFKNPLNLKEFGNSKSKGGKRKTRKNKKRKTRKGRKGKKGRKSRK